MEIGDYFFRCLLALSAASDLRLPALRAGALVNFLLRPLEEMTTALSEELLEEFAPDGVDDDDDDDVEDDDEDPDSDNDDDSDVASSPTFQSGSASLCC